MGIAESARYVVIGCALLLSVWVAEAAGERAGSGSANTPAPPPPTNGIGPAGGTVNGPNGTKLGSSWRAGGQHSNRDRADRCQRAAAAVEFQSFGTTFAFTSTARRSRYPSL